MKHSDYLLIAQNPFPCFIHGKTCNVNKILTVIGKDITTFLFIDLKSSIYVRAKAESVFFTTSAFSCLYKSSPTLSKTMIKPHFQMSPYRIPQGNQNKKLASLYFS